MSDLPPLVSLDGEVLESYRRSHETFFATESGSQPTVRSAARRLMQRLLVEALANVHPVFRTVSSPLLFPPPRRFLNEVSRQRIAGAEAAVRHIDSALTMATMPAGRPVLQPATPLVLHALLAGPVTERETNPGLLRVTTTNWMPDANPFEHPPAEHVVELLEQAVQVAATDSYPAIERAGWLAFVMMTVHPFVDGNGRTARALFLATSGTDLPGHLDWGVLDQWHLARDDYVRALQAGQRGERYAGTEVDPAPFVRFSAHSSTRGAAIGAARIELLTDAVDAVAELADEVVLRVIVDRFVSIDAALGSLTDPDAALAHIDSLVGAALLRVDRAPTGVPPDEVGASGLVVGEALEDVASEIRHARYVGADQT